MPARNYNKNRRSHTTFDGVRIRRYQKHKVIRRRTTSSGTGRRSTTYTIPARSAHVLVVSAVLFVIAITMYGSMQWFASRPQVLGEEEVIAIQVPHTFTDPTVFSNEFISMSLVPEAGNDVTLFESDEMFIYVDAYAYTDVVMQDVGDTFDYKLLLKREGHPDVFTYKVESTSAHTIFADKAGNIVVENTAPAAVGDGTTFTVEEFTLFTPFVQDQENRSFEAVEAIVEGDTVSLVLDSKWLDQATYPISIHFSIGK
ncbi:MAG: hypothetical protein ACPGO5_02515 [Patescibacteria group bacterium]